MTPAQAAAAGLTPELAQQLLDDDVANLIATVKGGGRLAQKDREMLAGVAKGANASPAPASAPTPASISEPAAQIPASIEPPPLVLISEADIVPLAEIPEPGAYLHPQTVYAERYGSSVRTIKTWLADGREAAKLPPLDDPEAMLSWWHGVKTNRPPARLLAAAESAKRARVGQGNSPLIQKREGAENAVSSPPPLPALPEPIATGFSATLDRVRTAEAKASRRYLEEFEKLDNARDDARTSRLRKEWSDLSEQLRFLEKAAPDVLGKSGEMLTRVEIARILTQLHGPIVSGMRTLFNRVEAKTGPQVTLEAARPTFKAEVERLLARLCESEFAPGIVLTG